MGFDSFIQHKKLFLVGIKGTGMTSLAAVLTDFGATVVGSDVTERFSTDAVLEQLHIQLFDSFDAEMISDDIDILIHSAAYSRETHSQIVSATERGIPTYSYPEWLAFMSENMPSYGVSGTHGKTTASGCMDWILRKTGLSFCPLYGSHLQGQSQATCATIRGSDRTMGLFEACEYRDHFLNYHLQGLLITTIEHDHPDWFGSPYDVLESFKQLVGRLPEQAPLVCGTDSELGRQLIDYVREQRRDLLLITYGEHHSSLVRLIGYEARYREASFSLSPLESIFHSRLGSVALCLDTIGAALLSSCMVLTDAGMIPKDALQLVQDPVFAALQWEAESFPGTSGRLDQLFVENDVVYIDDYAHHPTEIGVALESLRSRYQDHRILTIFHPHTVSRTKAYFNGFVDALGSSDQLVIRPVYASARHDGESSEMIDLGRSLAEATKGHFAENEDVVIGIVADLLRPGDVCVTMGAGNNSGLAKRIAERQRSK